MKFELVSEERIKEKAQAWQNQLADRTDHDRQVYAAGIRAGLEELGVVRLVEAPPGDTVAIGKERFSRRLRQGDAVLVRAMKHTAGVRLT